MATLFQIRQPCIQSWVPCVSINDLTPWELVVRETRHKTANQGTCSDHIIKKQCNRPNQNELSLSLDLSDASILNEGNRCYHRVRNWSWPHCTIQACIKLFSCYTSSEFPFLCLGDPFPRNCWNVLNCSCSSNLLCLYSHQGQFLLMV